MCSGFRIPEGTKKKCDRERGTDQSPEGAGEHLSSSKVRNRGSRVDYSAMRNAFVKVNA